MYLVFFVFIIILTFIIYFFEIILRYWFKRMGSFVWRPYDKYKFFLDEKAFPNFKSPTHFMINADGERGDTFNKLGKSCCRMLVAGGSAAECYFLDQKDSWPEVMAANLRSSEFLKIKGKKSLHVGNIGKSGMDTADLKEILTQTLPRYKKLDYLILFIGAGDVVNWLIDGAPQHINTSCRNRENIFSFIGDKEYKWKIKKTAIYEFIRFLRGRFTWQFRKNAGKTLDDVRLMRKNASNLINVVPNSRALMEKFEKDFSASIIAAIPFVVNIIVVRQPWFDKDYFSPEEDELLWHAPQGRPYLEKVDTYYSYSVFNVLMSQIDHLIVQLCKSSKLKCIDLKSHLDNSAAVYYDHLHFTAHGADEVGQLVSDFISRHSNILEN